MKRLISVFPIIPSISSSLNSVLLSVDIALRIGNIAATIDLA